MEAYGLVPSCCQVVRRWRFSPKEWVHARSQLGRGNLQYRKRVYTTRLGSFRNRVFRPDLACCRSRCSRWTVTSRWGAGADEATTTLSPPASSRSPVQRDPVVDSAQIMTDTWQA